MKLLAQQLSTFDFTTNQSQRIFHGRGHCYPDLEWLVVDYFAPVLFITIYELRDESELNDLRQILLSLPVEIIAIQHRYSQYEIENVKGQIPSKWFAQEGELKFHLQLGQQNIGLFLDMQKGREWLIQHSRDKNILNLFAYTCSLSVAACKGGARSVVNVDLSGKSLSKGQLNHYVNNLSAQQVSYLPHNIFKSWGKIKKLGLYDIIIVDPPSYQKGSFELHKDYRRLLGRIPELIKPNAFIMLALNAPNLPRQYLVDLVKELNLDWELLETLDRATGFEEKNIDSGLKVLIFKSRIEM